MAYLTTLQNKALQLRLVIAVWSLVFVLGCVSVALLFIVSPATVALIIGITGYVCVVDITIALASYSYQVAQANGRRLDEWR